MSPTRNPSEFKIQDLKTKFKTFGLSTTGTIEKRLDKSIDGGRS